MTLEAYERIILEYIKYLHKSQPDLAYDLIRSFMTFITSAEE